jgi:hypothetical protein
VSKGAQTLRISGMIEIKNISKGVYLEKVITGYEATKVF